MSIHEMLVDAGAVLAQRYAENTKHSIKERYHLLSESVGAEHLFRGAHLMLRGRSTRS